MGRSRATAQPYQHPFISMHYQAELSAQGGRGVPLCSPVAEPSTRHSITAELLLPRAAAPGIKHLHPAACLEQVPGEQGGMCMAMCGWRGHDSLTPHGPTAP